MELIQRIAATVGALTAGRQPKNPSSLRLVGRLSIGGTKTVSIIEFETMRFLVGASADSISCIHSIRAAHETDHASGPAAARRIGS